MWSVRKMFKVQISCTVKTDPKFGSRVQTGTVGGRQGRSKRKEHFTPIYYSKKILMTFLLCPTISCFVYINGG